MRVAGGGGQSKLVAPNNVLVACASQVKPERGPSEQVPPRTPSFDVASPRQSGHGALGGAEPTWMPYVALNLSAVVPSSRLVVPVTALAIGFTTHTEMPPRVSGSGAPR